MTLLFFEVLLVPIVVGALLAPQLIAGFMAKSMGKNFWFWFGISFIIPVISIFILMFSKDEHENKKIELADHVNRRKEE
jgi:hypothetical protein